MNQPQLTIEQAFKAMYTFLEKHYEMTHSDDIGALLGGMSMLEDGDSADPAIKDDWLAAVVRVQNGEVDTDLGLH